MTTTLVKSGVARPRKEEPQEKRTITLAASVYAKVDEMHDKTGVPKVRIIEDALRAHLGIPRPSRDQKGEKA